jgi:hypothetical protein
MLIRASVLGTYVAGNCSLRTFLLGAGLLFAVAGLTQAGEAPGVESVWGCLLYASNDRAAEKVQTQTQPQIPAQIRDYDERLEKLLGYASIQTLGQGETVVEPNRPSSIVFHGNIRVELTGLTRQPGEHFLVVIRLFQKDRQLIETQANVTRGSPLFIRGPLWRSGQLVVAVMVVSQRTSVNTSDLR